MLSSRNRDGSTPSRLAEVPQRGVVATQSANVGSRILEMCDFSQCVTIGEVQLDCDGHTSRYDHWDSREALRDAHNEL